MALCSRCQQRLATRQITDLAGHVVRLCDQCSAETGSFQLMPYTALVPVLSHEAAGSPSACPGFGYTLQRLSHSSHLGCAQCYRHFREPLRATVRRLHGSSCHFGRRPRRVLPTPDDLRRQLEQAIDEQRFEDAAGLRDRLRKLDDHEP